MSKRSKNKRVCNICGKKYRRLYTCNKVPISMCYKCYKKSRKYRTQRIVELNRLKKINNSRSWAIDNPERAAEIRRRWYIRNREKQKERSKRQYHANPQYYKDKNVIWRLNNPEKVKEYSRKKNAKRKIQRQLNREKSGKDNENTTSPYP